MSVWTNKSLTFVKWCYLMLLQILEKSFHHEIPKIYERETDSGCIYLHCCLKNHQSWTETEYRQ